MMMRARPLKRLPTFLLLLVLLVLVLPAAGPALAQRSGSTIPNDAIFEAIGAGPGITVCEMGAGDGELTIAVAKIAGGAGRVYSSELGEERISALQKRVETSGLKQITVVAGEPSKTNFPAGACDALFMRNVYHHFADPAAINASIVAALTPAGRAAVIDFVPPQKEAERPADRAKDGTHGVSPEAVVRELTAAGLEPVTTERGGDRWFMVVARKPPAR